MNKILIKQVEDKIQVFVYQNNELVEEYEESIAEKRLEGNIYLGKIKDVVKGMQSAFVDIGQEKKALIHLKDILPKESNITGNEELKLENYDISKIIKPGDEILVQIKRDCNLQKGPRVTKDIKIIGKYIILMPFSQFITVSKKIEDSKERNRLKEIIIKYLNNKNEEKNEESEKSEESNYYGAIIRTSAKGQDEQVIKNDIKGLIEKWDEIQKKAEKLSAPTELYNNNGIIGKLITDFEPSGLEIYTNSAELENEIKESIINKQNDENNLAKTNTTNNIKICFQKNIEEEIMNPRKVWLKSGGFITIDTTEALIAIDVNSGSFVGKNGLEDTVLKLNLEATKEIAKQIRLHDLGGIIIIDFIDMENAEDRQKVKERMQEELKKDRSKVQVLEFTKLGLLEITRKHIMGK